MHLKKKVNSLELVLALTQARKKIESDKTETGLNSVVDNYFTQIRN